MVEQLVVLFNSIWKTPETPDDWTKGIIVKLPKRSLSDYNNWKVITLSSTPGKVYTRVMLDSRWPSGLHTGLQRWMTQV